MNPTPPIKPIGQYKGYYSIFGAVAASLNYLEQTGRKLDMQKYPNEASKSNQDVIRDLQKAQEVILTYVNNLIGKMQVVSTSDIALATGYSEKLVVEILDANGLLFEDEDDL